MGNQGSFMEKVYIYLPVIMCHSKMDYSNKTTMWNIRAAYFAEQVGIFAFMAYFVLAIRRRRNRGDRTILVPDISQRSALTNNIPDPDNVMYRKTTYFQHEMTEVFQQLQQQFVALMLTIMAHFVLGFRPIILLQIFSTPYHFSENRLFRKFVLGLKPGYRVWGERFEGEVGAEKIMEGEGEGREGVGREGGGGGSGSEVVSASTEVETSPGGNDSGSVAENVEASGAGAGAAGAGAGAGAAAAVEVDAPLAKATMGGSGGGDGGEEIGGLPMPRALEDKLIDVWDAGEEGDWGVVMEEVGPLSVNTQTPAGKWSPLMVACGLRQVTEADIKTLVEDLDAQVDLRDQDGWTCLHWAAQHGRTGAILAVFEGITSLATEPSAAAAAIAELRAVSDGEGKTAADVAREAGLETEVLAEFLEALENGSP